MKFSIKDFSSECEQIHRKLRIWSYLLKKYLIESFIFLQWRVLPPLFPKYWTRGRRVLRKTYFLFVDLSAAWCVICLFVFPFLCLSDYLFVICPFVCLSVFPIIWSFFQKRLETFFDLLHEVSASPNLRNATEPDFKKKSCCGTFCYW